MDYTTENYLAHHGIKGQGDILISELPDGDYLEHYQIKGAKHGIRRFQNFDGSLTPAGRERYGVGPARSESKKTEGSKGSGKKKSSNSATKSLQKALSERKYKKAKKEEAKQIEDREGLKAYLRQHPKQLPKYNTALTEEEANEIIKNIQFDRKLKDIRNDEVRRGWQKVADVRNNVTTINGLMIQAKGIYNTTAEVYNMLIDAGLVENKKKMRKIGEGSGSDQNKAQK